MARATTRPAVVSLDVTVDPERSLSPMCHWLLALGSSKGRNAVGGLGRRSDERTERRLWFNLFPTIFQRCSIIRASPRRALMMNCEESL